MAPPVIDTQTVQEWIGLIAQLAWDYAEYTPSDQQWEVHMDDSRLRLVAGGVGAGKSKFTAMEVLRYIGTPDGLIWIIGPSYELANPEYDYVFEVCNGLGIIDSNSVSNVAKGSRKFRTLPQYGGCEVVTKSATNPEAIAGRRPTFLAASEAAQHPYEMLYKLMERGLENDAPIVMSGTFEGAYNWYAELWERWQVPNKENGKSFSLPTWSNLSKYPLGRQDPKILALEAFWPPDLFMERFGGVPCKPEGIVFREFSPSIHVRPLQELFDPDLPVELWVDPATRTYSVLFTQLQKDEKTVHILDEVYAKDTIGQNVIPQVIDTYWWQHSCTLGIMDAAGTRRMGANKSQIEVWLDVLRGMGTHTVSWHWREIKDVKIWYDAIHLRLWSPKDATPLIYFSDILNPRLTAQGDAQGILGELKTHRWADRPGHAPSASRPIKRNEDALSALGYGLYYHFGPVVTRPINLVRQRKPYF